MNRSPVVRTLRRQSCRRQPEGTDETEKKSEEMKKEMEQKKSVSTFEQSNTLLSKRWSMERDCEEETNTGKINE
jgi:hypothetical protein